MTETVSRAGRSTAGRNGVVLGCCAALAMVLLVVVAVSVSPNVIARHRFLQDYIAMSGALIPGVERLAAVSSFPEVTRLVFSLMWSLVPIFTAFFCVRMRVPEDFVARFRERLFFLTFCQIIVGLMLFFYAVLYDITPDDLVGGMINETVLRTVSTSRMGLGLIAGFLAAGLAGMLYMILIWALNLPRIYFRRDSSVSV